MEEALIDEEQARLRSVVTFQKVVLVIILRWWLLAAFVFCTFFAIFAGFLVMRGAKSVKRYEAKTRLLFSPKKILRVDAPSDPTNATRPETPSDSALAFSSSR